MSAKAKPRTWTIVDAYGDEWDWTEDEFGLVDTTEVDDNGTLWFLDEGDSALGAFSAGWISFHVSDA